MANTYGIINEERGISNNPSSSTNPTNDGKNTSSFWLATQVMQLAHVAFDNVTGRLSRPSWKYQLPPGPVCLNSQVPEFQWTDEQAALAVVAEHCAMSWKL
jgi:hypothetical protein